jgi:hypothetical protein
MDSTFGITTTPSPKLSVALLAIRIASALAFLYHGAAITFGAFGGPGPEKFAAFTHMPLIAGYLVGLAQLAGGLANVDRSFDTCGRSVHHHRNAGRNFPRAFAAWIRYWARRNGVRAHSTASGFWNIVDWAGSVLVGRLTACIVAQIII